MSPHIKAILIVIFMTLSPHAQALDTDGPRGAAGDPDYAAGRKAIQEKDWQRAITLLNKAAQKEIAMIKVVAPNVACQVVDQAIQLFGGAGVSDDFGLGWAYASARALRIADGPDEVHRNHIAKLELARYLPH